MIRHLTTVRSGYGLAIFVLRFNQELLPTHTKNLPAYRFFYAFYVT